MKTIQAFTAQSLGVPQGATLRMKLASGAREAPTTDEFEAEAAARSGSSPSEAAGSRSTSVEGRAQGLALTFGQGRVVALGEAALFRAQIITLPDGDRQVTFKAGMNAPGNDNRQFALNVPHWLSGLLPATAQGR